MLRTYRRGSGTANRELLSKHEILNDTSLAEKLGSRLLMDQIQYLDNDDDSHTTIRVGGEFGQFPPRNSTFQIINDRSNSCLDTLFADQQCTLVLPESVSTQIQACRGCSIPSDTPLPPRHRRMIQQKAVHFEGWGRVPVSRG